MCVCLRSWNYFGWSLGEKCPLETLQASSYIFLSEKKRFFIRNEISCQKVNIFYQKKILSIFQQSKFETKTTKTNFVVTSNLSYVAKFA